MSARTEADIHAQPPAAQKHLYSPTTAVFTLRARVCVCTGGNFIYLDTKNIHPVRVL